jgi:hypothetical protein
MDKTNKIGRYRSYTAYSEENGKLVPSIEPQEKNVKCNVLDNVTIIYRVTDEVMNIEKEKLKSGTLLNISKPDINVSTK